MISLNYLEITDSYIRSFVNLSSRYETLDRDIEYLRIQMAALRYELYSINISHKERQEINLLLERYLVIFRELLIERDKIPKALFIRIPYCPDYFPPSPSPGSYTYRPKYN